MDRIFTIDLKDYTDDMPHFKRPSVRAVITNKGKVAMVHSKKHDYYKFPGGGIESGENHVAALKREVLEETGLTIIESTIKELGMVQRIQKSRYMDNVIFDQENFYYLCDVNKQVCSQHLDEYELDEGFTLQYVSPEYAINVNRTHSHGDYDLMLIEREARVLEYLIKKELI